MASREHTDLLRGARMRAFALMRERDPQTLRGLVVDDAVDLLEATVARYYDVDRNGGFAHVPIAGEPGLPELAAELEAALLARAIARRRSLVSSHPQLDPDLAGLVERCRAERITSHALLVRARLQTYGAVVVHWVGKERPAGDEGRSVFDSHYWDTAGLAIAQALERGRVEAELAALRRIAYTDPLTGLPNGIALQEQLDANTGTFPFSVLMADFDGLRAANSAYGYSEGGDALIRAVAAGLAALARHDEFLARMNTAGDEFVILLPGHGRSRARRRRDEIEAALDELAVPARFDRIYLGASVGRATRRAGESPGQALGRAMTAMRERKSARRRAPGVVESPRTV